MWCLGVMCVVFRGDVFRGNVFMWCLGVMCLGVWCLGVMCVVFRGDVCGV